MAQPGSALALGARSRRFKSSHPDFFMPEVYFASLSIYDPSELRIYDKSSHPDFFMPEVYFASLSIYDPSELRIYDKSSHPDFFMPGVIIIVIG